MTLVEAACWGLGVGLSLGALSMRFYSRRAARGAIKDAETQWREKWERSREDFLGAAAELRATRALLSEQRQLNQEALGTMREGHAAAMEDLRRAFESLSRRIVAEAQPELAKATHDRLEEFRQLNEIDAEARQQAIEKMLIPLDERLRAYQERLAHTLDAQSDSVARVRESLEALGQTSAVLAAETRGFREALRSSQARGQWGENTLRRVIESVGLQEHCDFSQQRVIGEGKPDVVVHLPEGRRIIIDAKAPDFSDLSQLEGAQDAERREILRGYLARLKEHIKDLSKRDYPKGLDHAFEWTLLFLPAEALLHAGLEADSTLLSWAHGRRVLLTTPSSLMATLTTIAWSWRRLEQAEDARQIIDTAESLRSRIEVFLGHFDQLRSGLERANEAYNRAVGSYERSVEPAVRRLDAFRSSADTNLPTTAPQTIEAHWKPLPSMLREEGEGKPPNSSERVE